MMMLFGSNILTKAMSIIEKHKYIYTNTDDIVEYEKMLP